MTGTCSARIDQLKRMIGTGTLTGTVTVDQVYAHYQHERAELRHPRGGGPFYLSRPLMDGYRDWYEDYARTVLADGGQAAMRRGMEHLSDQVEIHAPREWGDLLKSGHPKVAQGGRVLYDRAPKAARLTRQELAAKSRAILRARLAAGLTVYFMKNGKIHVIPGKNEPHGLRGRL